MVLRPLRDFVQGETLTPLADQERATLDTVVVNPDGLPDTPSFIGGFDDAFVVENLPVSIDVMGFHQTGTIDQAPRYREGQQFQFSTMSPEATIDLQNRLIMGGFLSFEEANTTGLWFGAESDAMSDLMAIANGNGMTWQQALAASISSGRGQRMAARGRGGSGGARRPSIRLSNTDDLRLSFRNTARQISGGVFVDSTQIDNMVEAYQGIETAQQNALIAGATSVEDAPTAEGFAAGQLEIHDPSGAEANRFAGMASVLERMTSGA